MSRQEAIENRKKDPFYQKAVTDAWEEFIDNEVSGSILDPMTLDGDGYNVQIVFHGLLGLAIEGNEAYVHVLKDRGHKQAIIVKKGVAMKGTPVPEMSHPDYDFYVIHPFQEIVGNGDLIPDHSPLASMDFVNGKNERNSLNWLANPGDFLGGSGIDSNQFPIQCHSFKFSKGRIRTLTIEGLGTPTDYSGCPELFTWPGDQKRGMARSIAVEFKHQGDLEFLGNEVLKIMGPKPSDPSQHLAIHVVNGAASDGAATHFMEFYKLYQGSHPNPPGPLRAHNGDGSYLRYTRKTKFDILALNDACPPACFAC